MTATAFIDGIKKMPSLLPLQADQLIQLAPHMTPEQRAEAFAEVKKQHDAIETDVKEMDEIQTKVEQETKELYKKEWPKIKEAVQAVESAGAAAKLDEQIDAA